MKTIKDLDDELCRIQDDKIRFLTTECLRNAPPHFWYRPSSSTGKYHAPEENESGGLVVHTQRVCGIAEILIEAWPNPIKADVIRSACILHDICKYGTGYSATQHTLNNHPQIGADFIQEIAKRTFWGYEHITITRAAEIDGISEAVETHMGKWGKKPLFSHESLIVHLADVLGTKIHMGV